jgi:hypothetical protein
MLSERLFQMEMAAYAYQLALLRVTQRFLQFVHPYMKWLEFLPGLECPVQAFQPADLVEGIG